ncbi:MAG TPA: hypothetical protein VMT51_04380 [Dongiaceae bacterium]|nr:hypothetical protein [Dongiaceae bacterium]
MKSLRVICPALLLLACTAAFAQHEMKNETPQSQAEQSFAKLKTLAGTWTGKVTVAEHPEMTGPMDRVTFRVTSLGNALMHEMTTAQRPDDPITMIYLDGDRLLLTHFCDAGNRPRMTGKVSPDGKTFQFEMVDITGSTKYGHMRGVVFTQVDADHHTEDWTFVEPGDTIVHAHMDLERTK